MRGVLSVFSHCATVSSTFHVKSQSKRNYDRSSNTSEARLYLVNLTCSRVPIFKYVPFLPLVVISSVINNSLYIKYHSKYLAVLRSNHQITLSTCSYYLCFYQFSLILHLISP